MTPDLAKVDRNLKRLFAANAPDGDVEAYLSSEGVTVEQMAQYRPAPAIQPGAAPDPRPSFPRRRQAAPAPQTSLAPAAPPMMPEPAPQMPPSPPSTMAAPAAPAISPQSANPPAPAVPAPPQQPNLIDQYVTPVVNAVSSAGTAVKDAVVGKHDPRFKDVPQLEQNSGMAMDGLGDMTALGDKAYADVWAKMLGDRYIRTITDANGYPIIEFKGKDGQPTLGYVNKPGLDYKDVSRGLSATLPYLAGGAIAGGATKAIGLGGSTIANMATQGLGAAAASAGQDVGAHALGSEQGLDTTRLVIAGAAGMGGELIGRVVLPFLAKSIGDKAVWTADDMGRLTLTERGKQIAQREGVDPDIVVDAGEARRVLRETKMASNKGESIIKERTGEFGIPTSEAQRTKDPLAIQIEKDLRFGSLGQGPRQQMKDFDDMQAEALKRGALGSDGRTLRQPGQADYAPNSVAPHLSPKRGIDDMGKDTLGLSAQKGFLEAKKEAKRLETQAWKKVENVAPKSGAFETLPDALKKSLGLARINRDLTPNAHSMIEELAKYASGKGGASDEASEFLGQQGIRYVDEMRQTLLGMKNGIVDAKDRTAANKIYSGFLDWIDDAAEKSLLTGGVQQAAALREARGATRAMRGLLKPKDAMGKKTPAARALEDVENAATGEEVLAALLGKSGPKADFRKGGVKGLEHYKNAVLTLGGREGKDAWNDVRLAYWVRLVSKQGGDMHTPTMITNNVDDAFKHNKSLMNMLFSETEQKTMKRYADAVRQTDWKKFDVNPSGTGTVNRSAAGEVVNEALRFQAQSTRAQATFGQDRSKLIQSRLWRMLQHYVAKRVQPAKGFSGHASVRRAVSQEPAERQIPATGGYGAALVPNLNKDDQVRR